MNEKKKVVNYTVLDGVTPRKVGGLLALSPSMQLNFPMADATCLVKFGVKFDCQVMLVQSNSVVGDGVQLKSNTLVDANTDVTATFKSDKAVTYDRGETLVYVYPLTDDYELNG